MNSEDKNIVTVETLNEVATINPIEVFTNNGLEPIINKIQAEARSYVFDISTASGRKHIASLAHKIARSKTTLDDLGKGLTEEWKIKSKAVDNERKRMRDMLDALKEEIRSPLTDWENRDKERIATLEKNIADIRQAGATAAATWQTFSVDAARARLADIAEEAKKDWQEFTVLANDAIQAATLDIQAAIAQRVKYEADQAELVALRESQAKQQQKEREERIAAEASAAAEARARKDLEEANARTAKAEQEKKDADARAERERVAAEERRVAAEAKAKKDAELAAEAERKRIQDEQDRVARETAKREADKKHRAKIIKEAVDSLIEVVPGETAQLVIDAICQGKVTNVKIFF